MLEFETNWKERTGRTVGGARIWSEQNNAMHIVARHEIRTDLRTRHEARSR